jgi:hypothetical protein
MNLYDSIMDEDKIVEKDAKRHFTEEEETHK